MKATTARTKFTQLLRRLTAEHNSVVDECTLINNKRLLFGAAIAAAACLIPIAQLLFSRSMPDANPLWRSGVILANAVMCTGLLVVWFIIYRTHRAAGPRPGMRALQVITAGFFLLCGVSVTLLDQMQGGGISNFLLACISVAAVVLIRPLAAAALFAGAYTVMLIAGSYVLSADQMFFIRTNGLSCVCMGIVVSTILWRANCVNLLQSRQLEMQKHILEQMAYYDKLTGLTNRHLFDTIIHQGDAPEAERPAGALLMLDLDDFKRVNDTHGHPSGDAVLQQLALVLQETLRKTDVIARFGGEEFMVMLPKTSMQEASAVAEKLRMNIERTTFTLPDGTHEHMTASIGVAPMQKCDPYAAVDKALYKAKREGKNSVACYWDTPAEETE